MLTLEQLCFHSLKPEPTRKAKLPRKACRISNSITTQVDKRTGVRATLISVNEGPD